MHFWITRGLGVFETLLKRSGRPETKFALSDQPSLADICLIPQIYSANRVNVDMGPVSALPRYLRARDEGAELHREPSGSLRAGALGLRLTLNRRVRAGQHEVEAPVAWAASFSKRAFSVANSLSSLGRRRLFSS